MMFGVYMWGVIKLISENPMAGVPSVQFFFIFTLLVYHKHFCWPVCTSLLVMARFIVFDSLSALFLPVILYFAVVAEFAVPAGIRLVLFS
jgi:hypothetical protein